MLPMCESPAARNGKGRPSERLLLSRWMLTTGNFIQRLRVCVKRFFDESAIIHINKLGQKENEPMNWGNTCISKLIVGK